MLLLLSLACATRDLRPVDALDWDLHPELPQGTITVAPVIVVAEAPQVKLTDGVGETLDPWLAQGRFERTAELAELPYAFRNQVPIALHQALPPAWEGHFREGRLAVPQQLQIANAIQDPLLSQSQAMGLAAQSMEGEATLFTWVVEAEGSPLTDQYMVGELVWTEGVPVMVDHRSEPYQVHAELGIALVDKHGQVLFRYQGDYGGILSAEHGLRDLSRELAEAAVADIAPHWLAEPITEQFQAVARW
ncbi:MAG: hypothetical protein VX899_07020 [Myxococcota bacterium]|nr:hypothetical protein [Myxococcota bacterium]